MTDTIFARATASGRAAVAIVRISGPDSEDLLRRLTGTMPEPRRAAVHRLRDSEGEELDQALVLWMPGPNSFTGEDCAELHIHGGTAVFEALAATLVEFGLRWAEPGEFSRRAFAHGKMDLLQAEAVADLVDAETAGQRRQALAQLAGGVGRRYETWRSELIQALALLEAENDFPDEDLPGHLSAQAVTRLATVRQELEGALRTAVRGRGVREGYRIALIGAPNAGKSSLLNALLGRPAAIVSSTPGTTRDIVEASVVIGGHAVTLADTAGLRSTDDEVEQEGVRRARAWAESAAARLLLIDSDTGAVPPDLADLTQPGDLLVLSKADVRDRQAAADCLLAKNKGLDTLECSVVTSDGVGAVREWLESRVARDLESTEQPVVTRERHERSLSGAIEAIARAEEVAEEAPDRASEDVRFASQALRSVVGEVDREAVLDQVFSSFCIGK